MWTKKKTRAYYKQYYNDHRGLALDRSKAYAKSHSSEIRLRKASYRRASRDWFAACVDAYVRSHRAEILAYGISLLRLRTEVLGSRKAGVRKRKRSSGRLKP